MGLMMPPRAWGAEDTDGGSGATSWVSCGVGAIARASPQTAVAAVGGFGSASGGKSGAPTSAHTPSPSASLQLGGSGPFRAPILY